MLLAIESAPKGQIMGVPLLAADNIIMSMLFDKEVVSETMWYM